jgi:hypothetical protein
VRPWPSCLEVEEGKVRLAHAAAEAAPVDFDGLILVAAFPTNRAPAESLLSGRGVAAADKLENLRELLGGFACLDVALGKARKKEAESPLAAPAAEQGFADCPLGAHFGESGGDLTAARRLQFVFLLSISISIHSVSLLVFRAG